MHKSTQVDDTTSVKYNNNNNKSIDIKDLLRVVKNFEFLKIYQ
jgi:hypothetical protein